ncbi:MAG TPA: hypothetical protein VHV82_18325 [Sporichthyaceae bacterium]|nr:hypothetical protein [Sporichthyaceae bacterium]
MRNLPHAHPHGHVGSHADTSTALPWLAVGALVAACADAAFAFVAYVLIDGRYNFETLLQYIASGLAGQRAFATGSAGIGYAALGFAIHLVLAVAFTGLYWLTVAPRVRSAGSVVVAGLAYGAAIWVFMNAVVLPIGRSTQESFANGWWFAFLVDHALFVGLPIAIALAPAQVRTQILRRAQ